MLDDKLIVLSALAYIGLLFAIAYYGDKRADSGRSLVNKPVVYTLSIAVYCTAWTFYGSVGRAASTGVGFLPIYLGPTLVALLFWLLLRRIVRIAKTQRITSIADLIASRYGKSQGLAGLVTVIAIVGIMPYISIQLEAIALSFAVLRQYPVVNVVDPAGSGPLWLDSSFYTALLLIVFAILFGTRHIDTTERHEGLVAAIAFESVVKLFAFLAVGLFISYGVFNGLGDIFARAMADPELSRLLDFGVIPGGFGGWLSLTFISMAAFLFLPRQFQMLVVENTDERHLRTASWLFPLYLLVINLFVLPIALGGLLEFKGQDVDADTFVLALPMFERQPELALLVFIGGLSAATSMVIAETVALSTMICNDLIMPLLLRSRRLRLHEQDDLSGLLLTIRRLSIAIMVLLGYLFFRYIGHFFPLVTIGLLSFAAAAQFAPAILLGLYWRGATHTGAILGISGGFLVWVYTLLLPFSGWLGPGFIEQGPAGIDALRPYQLLGLEGLDPITHGVFWSMLVNIGLLVLGSLLGRQDAFERVQANRFVNALGQTQAGELLLWQGSVQLKELQALVARYIGRERAVKAFAEYARSTQVTLADEDQADAALINHAERLLAGAIGAASARVLVGSIAKGRSLDMDEVMTILDESSQLMRYSQKLERQSRELSAAYAELREANARLRELDQLKDEFVSTVSHELRTPLTSIRAFSEILLQNPELAHEQREEFLSIIVKESERLTRLINQVLDMAKLESGRIEWNMADLDLRDPLREAIAASSQLFRDNNVALNAQLADDPVLLYGDSDRLTQVFINLLSNAVKFCPHESGQVDIELAARDGADRACIRVRDNGPGISADQLGQVFERFHQVNDQQAGKPVGTGLGLAISKSIIEHHQGSIRVENIQPHGALFVVELPLKPA